MFLKESVFEICCSVGHSYTFTDVICSPSLRHTREEKKQSISVKKGRQWVN